MTIRELKDAIEQYPDDMPIAKYNPEMAEWEELSLAEIGEANVKGWHIENHKWRYSEYRAFHV